MVVVCVCVVGESPCPPVQGTREYTVALRRSLCTANPLTKPHSSFGSQRLLSSVTPAKSSSPIAKPMWPGWDCGGLDVGQPGPIQGRSKEAPEEEVFWDNRTRGRLLDRSVHTK